MTEYNYALYTNVHVLVTGPYSRDGERLEIPYLTGYRPYHVMCKTWQGQIQAASLKDAAVRLMYQFNQDDRPTGQICPSLSVGDVIVLSTPDGDVGMAIDCDDFRAVRPPEVVDDREWFEIFDNYNEIANA